jgi:hypothetical protein
MIEKNIIKIQKNKISKTSMDNNKNIEFNYEKELSEDKQLQEMLLFCENKDSYAIDDELKNMIGYYFYFCEEKINYLENLQESFGLSNNQERLTDIIKYLDGFTVQESQHKPLNDFAVKISSLLDLLYIIKIDLKDFYMSQNEFNTQEDSV